MTRTSDGPTLEALAVALAAGRTSARALTEHCLAAIADPAGEGARAFLRVDAQRALAQADEVDRRRKAGAAPSRFAGAPIAIKDLFDVRGEVTRAGSRALDDAPPAEADAPSVARLRQAGFVLIGRTNMSEFAYSGLGLNPHFGTPRSVFDRATGRAPGGSTSGGAVAVADSMAAAALGTDTGGSCRIPAAFNGLVGWKPTAARMPAGGLIPLSPTFDTIGPIGRSVACCVALDSLLAGVAPTEVAPTPLAGRRLLVPTTVALDDLEPEVTDAFEQALRALSAAGARIDTLDAPELAELLSLASRGGLTAAEAYHWHRELLAQKGGLYDPRVASRIRNGAGLSDADARALRARRAELIAALGQRLAGYDAMILPTVAAIPPRLADLTDDAAFSTANLRALRNTMLVNLLDGCAISLPITPPGAAPVGLMIAGLARQDRAILSLAAGIEPVVAQG